MTETATTAQVSGPLINHCYDLRIKWFYSQSFMYSIYRLNLATKRDLALIFYFSFCCLLNNLLKKNGRLIHWHCRSSTTEVIKPKEKKKLYPAYAGWSNGSGFEIVDACLWHSSHNFKSSKCITNGMANLNRSTAQHSTTTKWTIMDWLFGCESVLNVRVHVYHHDFSIEK